MRAGCVDTEFKKRYKAGVDSEVLLHEKPVGMEFRNGSKYIFHGVVVDMLYRNYSVDKGI
jgi:hypothetical protein